MFHHIFVFVVLCFVTCALSNAQNNDISAIYTKLKSSVVYETRSDKEISDISQRFRFILQINDSLSTYQFIKPNQNIKDDIYIKSLIFTSYEGPYFFNLNQNLIYRKKGKYLLEKSFDDFQWYLTEESKKLKGFNCYKATTTFTIEQIDRQGNSHQFKEVVTAWYTTDICVSIGPDGFAGLPGLIIRLEIHNEITELESIEFNQNIQVINLPSYKEKMTETEFKVHTEAILDKINDVKGDD